MRQSRRSECAYSWYKYEREEHELRVPTHEFGLSTSSTMMNHDDRFVMYIVHITYLVSLCVCYLNRLKTNLYVPTSPSHAFHVKKKNGSKNTYIWRVIPHLSAMLFSILKNTFGFSNLMA